MAVEGDKPSYTWLAVVTLFLVVLSLVKFTFFVSAITVLFSISLNILGNRGRWQALLPLSLFAGLFCLLWLVLGQSLVNVPRYLYGSLQISSGYDAMALAENPRVFSLGILVLASLGGALLPFAAPGFSAGWRSLGSLRQVSRLSLVTTAVFMNWKHGFVRHGGTEFFCFTVLALFLLPVLFPVYDWRAVTRVRLTTACFVLGLFGLTVSRDFQWTSFLSTLPDSISMAGRTVLNPSELKSDLEIQQVQREQAFTLPLIKARVREASVDVISCDQSVLFLNKMNWKPRPVFQSYTAYTPFLLEANAQFYRSDNAPEFVLFKLQPIDNRFPPLEDGLALLEILPALPPGPRRKRLPPAGTKPASLPGQSRRGQGGPGKASPVR